MPNQYAPEPIERLQSRGMNGKTLGGRDIEVRDVSGMQRHEPPPAPEGLAERGSLEWRKIWVAGPWLWPDQDYAWIEQVCRAYDDIARFREEVGDNLIVEGYNGQSVANPLIKEIRALEAVIQKCLSEIGFSPSARARLKLADLKSEKLSRDLLPDPPPSPGPHVVKGYVEGEW